MRYFRQIRMQLGLSLSPTVVAESSATRDHIESPSVVHSRMPIVVL
jgi:hypothetical protein